MKTVSALMPIMWILAFILAYNNNNAKRALNKPPKKKKYKGGNRSGVILFSIKIVSSMMCNNKGIFR